MWSRPFIRTLPSGEKVAVILMDTQGLYDGKVNKMITTAIFALSTLISSHVIYNMVREVGEDDLENLALFTEYGRRAQELQQEGYEHAVRSGENADDAIMAAAEAADASHAFRGAAAAAGGAASEAPTAKRRNARAARPERAVPPFQRIDFLVRDTVLHAAEAGDDIDVGMAKEEMVHYLDSLMNRTTTSDNRALRDQITACYEEIGCYLLPNPGKPVTRLNYGGQLNLVDEDFKQIVSLMIHEVFNVTLAPKKINGRMVNARQMGRYMDVYSQLFASGMGMPKPTTIIEATCEANNRNARDQAFSSYIENMNVFFNEGYKPDSVIAGRSNDCMAAALEQFDLMAAFGRRDLIRAARSALEADLSARHAEYLVRNKERNPTSSLGLYILSVLIILAAWFLKQVADWTCGPWSDVCRRGAQFFGFIYSTLFIATLTAAIFQGYRFFNTDAGKSIVSAAKFIAQGNAAGGLLQAASAVTQSAKAAVTGGGGASSGGAALPADNVQSSEDTGSGAGRGTGPYRRPNAGRQHAE